jgi:uncharacterized protein (DUF1800 family)
MRAAAILAAAWLILLSLLPAATADSASDRQIVHVLNRVAFGPTLEDLRHVEEIGVDRYIAEQLDPTGIAEPYELEWNLAQLGTLRLDAAQLRRIYGPLRPALGIKPSPEAVKAQNERAQAIVREASEARVLRAILSRRQLQEVMVDFWFNHFNVFSGKGLDRLWIGNYEEQAIRPFVLGRFRDLLQATTKHPAMLVYLDNTLSTAPGSPGARGAERGLNENFARELMELHTLGVDGGYTQDDVVTLARVLTGWSINRADGGEFPDQAAIFDATRHDFAPKVFLGRPLRARGRAEGEEALDILARSPATARHIAFELAQYFVADEPPAALVGRLAGRFQATGGNIREVLKTLFASPEFRGSVGRKYKTPYQLVISAVRAAGVPVLDTRPLLATMRRLGMPLYGCQTPDGYKNTEDAWLSPDATTRRIGFAAALANGGLAISAPSRGGLLDVAAGPRPAHPVDAGRLQQMFAATLGPATREVVAAAPGGMRAALILGSPDFMRR